MKALIRSGFVLALGWLVHTTSSSSGQEIPIKWQAAGSKQATSATRPAPAEPIRPVGLSQPLPLEASGAFTPIVRMQAPDEKKVAPVPQLEIFVQPEPNPLKKLPNEKNKDKSKEGFTPPAPSPVYESLGLTADDCCLGDSCFGDRCGRWAHLARRCCFMGIDGCDRPNWWVSAEFLAWWQRGHNTPPLVTSSPAGTATINSGVLGLNSTTVLYDRFPEQTRTGGRFSIGTWCPHFCNLGFEVGFFMLGRQHDSAVFGSNGDPQFARPIFNALTSQQGSQLVSIDNQTRFLTGSVSVDTYSQLWGANANLRRRLWCGPNFYVDGLLGYRHLNLSEGIDITENLQNFDPRTRQPAGNFLVYDSFRTRNQFNGVLCGLESEWRVHNRWTIGSNFKLSTGTVHQIVNIDGRTTFSNFPAGFNNTFPGGLLALPGTNIGRYSDNRFAFVPEVGVKFGFDITDHLRIFFGYDILYVSSVVRPGDQIDLRVNPNFQPSAAGPGSGVGPRVPAPFFNTTSYWAQGLNFGLLYRY